MLLFEAKMMVGGGRCSKSAKTQCQEKEKDALEAISAGPIDLSGCLVAQKESSRGREELPRDSFNCTDIQSRREDHQFAGSPASSNTDLLWLQSVRLFQKARCSRCFSSLDVNMDHCAQE